MNAEAKMWARTSDRMLVWGMVISVAGVTLDWLLNVSYRTRMSGPTYISWLSAACGVLLSVLGAAMLQRARCLSAASEQQRQIAIREQENTNGMGI